MEDFLKYLITPLLSEPSKLKVSQVGDTITVKVADSDTGRIIGKGGNIINAIRILLKTYCTNHQITPKTLTLQSPPKPSVSSS